MEAGREKFLDRRGGPFKLLDRSTMREGLTIRELVRIGWRYARWRLPLLVLMAFASSTAEMFGIAMALPLFNVASSGTLGNDAFTRVVADICAFLGIAPNLVSLLAITVVAFIAKAVFMFLTAFVEIQTTTTIRKETQIRLARLIENASFQYHYATRAGANTNLLSRECERFTSTIRNLARGTVFIVNALVFLIASVSLSPQLSIVLFLTCSMLIVLLRPLARWTRNYSVLTTEYYSAAQSALLELVNNIVYLKATHRTASLQDNLEDRIGKLAVVQKRIGLISTFLTVISEPLGVLALAGIIFYQVAYLGQPIGEVLVIGMIFYRLVQQMVGLQNNWQRINSSIGGVFAVEKAAEELNAQQERPTGKQDADLTQELVLTGVNVDYGDRAALTDIDLTIPPFQTVGIVGPSGAGKSTLFHVITSLLPPSCGHIRLGETDYSDIDPVSLRRKIGYVSQETAMFHATLAENIAFWSCDPNDKVCYERIKVAAKHAGITELLTRSNEQMGEQGRHLSGGQRQRVAIARELFKNPALLIFDEATSALDSKSEMAIQQSINSLHGERTILIIAHRLSSVRECDKIVVLDKGRIVQEGSFEQLARMPGLFREMCNSQGIVVDATSQAKA